ncbi:MAG TPA: hypothetical protein HPP59_03415, partial [Deltaproteobacteria bacterium]|nr:hypothetical protein [Deltaproteobacteria bacterium]
MKKTVKILSFLFLGLSLGLFYQNSANCAGGVSIVEDPGKQQTKSSGGGVRLMEHRAEKISAGETGEMVQLNAGIDELSRSLMERIATKYFHNKNKPVIKIAIFDFTDQEGNITVGSRYISNRIRVAFGSNQPFKLLPAQEIIGDMAMAPDQVDQNHLIRERMADELGADVYILGAIKAVSMTDLLCRVSLWGTVPPHFNTWELEPFGRNIQGGGDEAPNQWKLNFTKSGFDFFARILAPGEKETAAFKKELDLAQVVFLSQPLVDDLNLSWKIKGDGLVYDERKEDDAGSLGSRTGEVMQSRVKSLDTLKEMSYIIKECSLVIKESTDSGYPLEPYVLQKSSDYYFIPFEKGDTGLRFMYLWNRSGKSKRLSMLETGMGWKLHTAEQDWPIMMKVGLHIATATLKPLAESDYGTKKPRAEFVTRFKFSVKPGLNIYVINYVYRRDRPEIFVRRLEIEASKDDPVKG